MCPTDLNLDTVDRAGPLCNIVTFQIKQLKASFFYFFVSSKNQVVFIVFL